MNIRTDLAMEAHDIARRESKGIIDGITSSTEQHNNVKITRVEILTDEAGMKIGKEKGSYVTLEAPYLRYSLNDYEDAVKLISYELIKMSDVSKDDIVLVAGLGNRAITPDALGCRVIDKLLVTRHMQEFIDAPTGNVCAVAPGVLGTTGIETSDIIKGVTEKLSPSLIIAVDALAAADISRVSTTIQLADTGIQPGAGIGNNRKGLNRDTLGVKVIAIGVPTVIDAATISKVPIPEELAPLTVTTKDIDLVIERMSKTVANGINLALHRELTLNEIEELTA
ncbi:MAG: GPR endopeptidase [bacterium]|nr:GPR endopeptidase [bacterium]